MRLGVREPDEEIDFIHPSNQQPSFVYLVEAGIQAFGFLHPFESGFAAVDPSSEICPFTVLRSLFHLIAEPRVEGFPQSIAVEPDLCARLEHVLVVMLNSDGIFLTRAS